MEVEACDVQRRWDAVGKILVLEPIDNSSLDDPNQNQDVTMYSKNRLVPWHYVGSNCCTVVKYQLQQKQT